MENTKIDFRTWLVFIIVGLAGQFAWSIENMYLNTYITYLNFTSKTGGFDYSLMIAITTAASAVVATLTTIFMGGLTDKLGKRKIFIALGYMVWGLSTASFGLLNVTSSSALIPVSMTASSAAIMVIVIDCLMTFFGSTSNDAAFNSYVTKNTSDANRSKVEGVLSILPLVSMLFIFVGLNNLTTESGGYRWDLFFYIIGGLVFLVGLIAFFLIPKEKEEHSTDEKYFSLIIEGFRGKTIAANKLLYLTLTVYFIYGVATQVFFPYLMVYIEKSCSIANTGSGLLTPFAAVMAIALILGSICSVIFGFLSDRFGRNRLIIPAFALLGLGLICMFIIPSIGNDTSRTVFAAVAGFLMICGYVSVPTVINAIVRESIPKGKEGIFMGVRMIFVVALPMCIGPFIGDALNSSFGEIYTGQYGVSDVTPTRWGYLVALGILFVALIPIFFIFRLGKEQTHESLSK